MKHFKSLAGLTLASVMLFGSLPVNAAATSVSITSLNFPDKTFRKIVQELDDSGNMNGKLDYDEIKNFTSLNLNYCDLKTIFDEEDGIAPIEDLTGIKYFTNLKRLDVSHNNLTSIDQEEIKNLEFLNCACNRFTTLDLSELTSLKRLYAYGNSLINIGLPEQLEECLTSDPTITMYTDQGDKQKYEVMIFEGYKLIFDSNFDYVVKVEISCTCYPGNGGSVSGTGRYKLGETVSLVAHPNEGYVFDHYEQNGEVITNQSAYTFEVGDAASFVAYFRPDGNAPQPTVDPDVTVTATPTPTPTTDPSSKTGNSDIEDFVNRIYIYVLDREPEKDGAAFWSKELYNFNRTGAEVAQGFINSEEFINRKTSNDEFVVILYKTFFGRHADTNGLNYWINELTVNKRSRADVANDFIFSQEWADTCARYGIRSGSSVEPVIEIEPTELTTNFVERMYTTCMGRASDPTGRDYWAKQLANFNLTGEACGVSFFLSDEFVGFNLPNSEFVTRLYRTFMNREPDADGINYWLEVLKTKPRSEVVYGFTRSPEFMDKCVEARILPY